MVHRFSIIENIREYQQQIAKEKELFKIPVRVLVRHENGKIFEMEFSKTFVRLINVNSVGFLTSPI